MWFASPQHVVPFSGRRMLSCDVGCGVRYKAMLIPTELCCIYGGEVSHVSSGFVTQSTGAAGKLTFKQDQMVSQIPDLTDND